MKSKLDMVRKMQCSIYSSILHLILSFHSLRTFERNGIYIDRSFTARSPRSGHNIRPRLTAYCIEEIIFRKGPRNRVLCGECKDIP